MLIGSFNLVGQLKLGVVAPVESKSGSCSHVRILRPHYRRPAQMADAVGANCQRPSQKLTCTLIQINLVTNYL